MNLENTKNQKNPSKLTNKRKRFGTKSKIQNKKKSKSTNRGVKLFKEEEFDDVDNVNVQRYLTKKEGKFHIKKKKTKKDNISTDNVTKTKKKKKRKGVVNENEEKISNIVEPQKKKKQKDKIQLDCQEPGSIPKIEKVNTPRSSPNAGKFMFINIIKKILLKKVSLSKDKLQKKVMKKFCKVMNLENKPELIKTYEKSLMLTYGIEVLEDSVRLKQ